MTNKTYRLVLALVGFSSTVAQVVLMRELVATFYGNELLLGLVLMAWLAWVAVGAWGLPRLVQVQPLGPLNFQPAIRAGLALAAVVLPVQIALVRGARLVLGVTPGALAELGPMVGVVVLVLAPLCLLIGFLFTMSARASIEQGGAAGQAFVWESAGAVVGGMLASFLFIRYLDSFQTALLVSALDLAVALEISNSFLPFAHRLPIPISQSRTFLLLLVFCLFLLTALGLGPVLHNATVRWQWPNLAFAADSPYGRLAVQANGKQRVFFQNGSLVFETQGTSPEEATHLPLLMHPNPRSVLLVGGGVAGDLGEILKHPVASVTYVELDPLLIKAAQANLPPEDSAVLGDPRVRLALTDGRQFVRQCAAAVSDKERCAFDVVILDLPEPATGALNRFYTREFFAQVRALLHPDGILAFGLPSAENYWSPELTRRNGSIYQTLLAVLPQVLVFPGEHIFFVASNSPLESDPAALAQRLSERGIATRQVTPAYIDYIFATDRFARAQQELQAAQGVRINEDMSPICYYYDLTLWLARFSLGLRTMFESAAAFRLWWAGAPLALMVALARWRRAWAVPLTVACTGLAQMMLEVVVIFSFQVLHGSVYAEVSLIVTAFMAGLMLGGIVGTRVANLKPKATQTLKLALMAVQAAVAIDGGVVLLVLALPIQIPSVFVLLAALAGGLAGMAFPLAVALAEYTPGHAVGMLYGADLVGGCLGALFTVVFFVPVLGLAQTCAVIALVGLAGLLAIG